MSGLPTAKILAVIERTDAGEGGGACCPHCGAQGRYIFRFVCDDGVTRGAMAGCFKLFRRADGPIADLTRRAHEKLADARLSQRQAASWWAEIIEATERLGRGEIGRDDHRSIVLAADGRRRSWLNRNGYGRGRR
jgi:hypothetical protein